VGLHRGCRFQGCGCSLVHQVPKTKVPRSRIEPCGYRELCSNYCVVRVWTFVDPHNLVHSFMATFDSTRYSSTYLNSHRRQRNSETAKSSLEEINIITLTMTPSSHIPPFHHITQPSSPISSNEIVPRRSCEEQQDQPASDEWVVKSLIIYLPPTKAVFGF
jgi:hypothetical protein